MTGARAGPGTIAPAYPTEFAYVVAPSPTRIDGGVEAHRLSTDAGASTIGESTSINRAPVYGGDEVTL